jgi:hypothetical protein
MEKEFSQDWEIVRVYSSSEPQLATKWDLDNRYDINDLFDFLEALDARDEMTEIQQIESKAEQDRQKQQQDLQRSRGR